MSKDRTKLPEWARGMRPACPACGHYLLPCTATASGLHPGWRESEQTTNEAGRADAYTLITITFAGMFAVFAAHWGLGVI